ncbi:MAG TPA: YbaY family lipoprotein [Chloroflexaceae bacterium]|nr:YbaY family lipoprotein [Chloroflexaceae bacterium]
MKPIRTVWTLAFAIVLLAVPRLAAAQGTTPTPGPATSPPPQLPEVTGTITYRDRVALPANAVVTVQIARVYADRGPEIISERSFPTNGAQQPFAYRFDYDPGRIDQNASYTVQSNINVGGQVRYSTNTIVPVITRGNPTQNVTMTLVARGTLPNTSGGAWPLALAGAALLAALAIFAVRRRRAA